MQDVETGLPIYEMHRPLGPPLMSGTSMPSAVARSILMVLLLHENLPNLFCHRVFSKHFTLPDAIAVIANGFILIVEIEPEHVFRILRCAHWLGCDGRHFAQIVDLRERVRA